MIFKFFVWLLSPYIHIFNKWLYIWGHRKHGFKTYFLRTEKKSHFSLKIDDAKSAQLNKIIFLIKLKLFNSDNTKFNSFKIIQYILRNWSFKKCQQTHFWAKMVKSGQKMLILFTFYFFVYFLKCILNPGKLIKLNSPVKLRQRVPFPRIELLWMQKTDMRLFFRVGGSIF